MATTTAFLPGNVLWRESEFVGGLTGACGPNALAMAASWARQSRVSTLSVYQTMRAHSLCDANGVSTIGALRAAAPLIGLTVASYRAYAEPWDYAAFKAWGLAQLAAGNAFVLEGANCQAYVDALTGKGENATNLRYHFILVVGYVSGRWVCLDGDNLAVGNVAQHYTDDVMSAARPCAALAIKRIVALAPTTTTGAGRGFDAWCAAHGVTGQLYGSFVMPPGRYGAIYLSDAKHPNGVVLYGRDGQPVTDQAPADVAAWLYDQWQAAQKAAKKVSE